MKASTFCANFESWELNYPQMRIITIYKNMMLLKCSDFGHNNTWESQCLWFSKTPRPVSDLSTVTYEIIRRSILHGKVKIRNLVSKV